MLKSKKTFVWLGLRAPLSSYSANHTALQLLRVETRFSAAARLNGMNPAKKPVTETHDRAEWLA